MYFRFCVSVKGKASARHIEHMCIQCRLAACSDQYFLCKIFDKACKLTTSCGRDLPGLVISKRNCPYHQVSDAVLEDLSIECSQLHNNALLVIHHIAFVLTTVLAQLLDAALTYAHSFAMICFLADDCPGLVQSQTGNLKALTIDVVTTNCPCFWSTRYHC